MSEMVEGQESRRASRVELQDSGASLPGEGCDLAIQSSKGAPVGDAEMTVEAGGVARFGAVAGGCASVHVVLAKSLRAFVGWGL